MQSVMNYSRKESPRAEYRLSRNQRVNDSTTLAQQYPGLKTLTVSLTFFDVSRESQIGAMKYKPNLAHAKSLLCVNCLNQICVGGDYDLTGILAQAVAKHQSSVAGELRCQGTLHNKERAQLTPCQSILRYTLTLRF